MLKKDLKDQYHIVTDLNKTLSNENKELRHEAFRKDLIIDKDRDEINKLRRTIALLIVSDGGKIEVPMHLFDSDLAFETFEQIDKSSGNHMFTASTERKKV